jgi:TusA-related sulfurtransferase
MRPEPCPGHEVELREVRDQLQYGAHLDVLEVEGDALADVVELVAALLGLASWSGA